MDYSDNFERRRVLEVGDDIGVNRPEPVPRIRQIFPVMAHPACSSQARKGIVQSRRNLVCAFDAVLRDVIPDFKKVSARLGA